MRVWTEECFADQSCRRVSYREVEAYLRKAGATRREARAQMHSVSTGFLNYIADERVAFRLSPKGDIDDAY